MRLFHSCLCALALLAPSLAVSLQSEQGDIAKLSRTIELTAGLSRIQSTLTLLNVPDALRLAVPADIHSNLSSMTASLKETKANLQILKKFHDLKINAWIYDLDLSPAADRANVTIALQEVYAHVAKPLPASLSQTDMEQLFIWHSDVLGGLAIFNKVQEAKIRVKVPTPQVKSFSTPETFTSSHSAGSATIVYTSKAALSVGSSAVALVHYFQPEPVMAYKELTRTVQVSHWSSSVAFEDTIALVNNGPTLKGQFSRLDHQRQTFTRRGSAAAPHVLSGLTIPLPARAFSPYYYDIVGNVSTSHFRPSHDAAAASRGRKESYLDLKPRYPILGGWTYNFTVGYQVPLHHYLRRGATDLYHLAVPFIGAVKDIPIDLATVSVLLPEGAKLESISTPFAVDSMSKEITFTYLDTTGHPTITFKRAYCADIHNQDILITYRYSTLALLQKPIAATLAFLLVLCTSIAFRRLDWSLSKPKTNPSLKAQ